MSVENEQTISENAPRPAQLRRLAMIGGASALERKKIRRLNKLDNALFFIDEVDLLAVDARESDELVRMRHRMSARLGRKALSDSWSFKFYDTYWVEQSPGTWSSERAQYRFEWTADDVYMAERQIRVVSEGEYRPERDLADELDHFFVPDDQSYIWHAQYELERLTAGDVDMLIDDARAYYSQPALQPNRIA